MDPHYRFPPDLELLPVPPDRLLIRADRATVRLSGRATEYFLARLVPELHNGCALSELAALCPGVARDSLQSHLESLVRAGVLQRTSDRPGEPPIPERWMPALLGTPAAPALGRGELRARRVAIFGLEGHGRHLAAMLCRSGIGTLVLADPFPCQPGNPPLMGTGAGRGVGRPREQVALNSLREDARGTALELGGDEEVTEATVERIAAGVDLMVGCFDRGFVAAHLWINRASLKLGVPAIYSDVRAARSIVGPLVDPRRSACFVCYRTRSLACEHDPDAALAFQDHSDRSRLPLLHERGVLPGVLAYVAGQLCAEILKRLLRAPGENLVGRVLEAETAGVGSRTHSVLRVPWCSACGEPPCRTNPPLESLLIDPAPEGDILAASAALVSERTGVFVAEWPRPMAPGDLPRPHQEAVEIANHRLRTPDARRRWGWAWGKGLSRDEMRRSALGEAVERYSAEQWWEEEITHARRRELAVASIDPRALVLYAPQQYALLPYSPYRDETRLGWVESRSLPTGRTVMVPAIAVFTGYRPCGRDEYLCPTGSSGTATSGTLLAAILGGLLEVLERDAFMLTWLGRRRCRAVPASSHPDPGIKEIVASLSGRGVEVRLFQLPTDHPVAVFAAVAVGAPGSGPAAALGLGADLALAASARRAILEMSQVWHAMRAQLQDPASVRRMRELAAAPSRVATLEDHPLYYAAPEALPNLDFLFASRQRPISWAKPAPRSPAECMRVLVEHFASRGQDVLYRNLTPPDMRGLNLHTARVILPDFQPLHFGAAEARLGGRKLHQVVSRAAADGEAPIEINTAPHPLG